MQDLLFGAGGIYFPLFAKTLSQIFLSTILIGENKISLISVLNFVFCQLKGLKCRENAKSEEFKDEKIQDFTQTQLKFKDNFLLQLIKEFKY